MANSIKGIDTHTHTNAQAYNKKDRQPEFSLFPQRHSLLSLSSKFWNVCGWIWWNERIERGMREKEREKERDEMREMDASGQSLFDMPKKNTAKQTGEI